MKKRVLSILVLPFIVLLFGCKTLSPPDLIAFISARAGEAVIVAVASDISANPGHRPAFVTCIAALDGLMQQPGYSSAEFKAALAALPIKEFQGSQGALVLSGAVMVFDLVTMFAYDVTTAPALLSVSLAVRDGIKQGLTFQNETRNPIQAEAARIKARVAAQEPTAAKDQLIPVRRVKI